MLYVFLSLRFNIPEAGSCKVHAMSIIHGSTKYIMKAGGSILGGAVAGDDARGRGPTLIQFNGQASKDSAEQQATSNEELKRKQWNS